MLQFHHEKKKEEEEEEEESIPTTPFLRANTALSIPNPKICTKSKPTSRSVLGHFLHHLIY